MDRTEMLKDLAQTLLADAVASECDNELNDPINEDEAARGRKIRDAIIQPQRDLCETLEEFCEEVGIDLESYLPTELIEEIEADVNARWAGKLTLEKLYAESERAAHRLVLNALGHGVSADDDLPDAEIFERVGIPDDERRPVGYFESPWDQAGKLLTDAVDKL